MEPIRPDDDELRAGTARSGKPEEKKPARERQAKPADHRNGPDRARPGNPPPPPPPSGGGSGKGGSGKPVGLLVMLLLVSVAAGAGLVWQQAQRLAVLEEQVEEADYWVRQSKLTLARFEGDLTETGESLEQRGSTIEQRLAEQKDQIATASSEIRKLWVIANERNKKLLEEQAAQIASLKATVDEQAGSLAGLSEVQEGVTAVQEGVKSDIGSVKEAVNALDGETDTLAANDESLRKQLETLVSEVSALDAGVEQSLQRFRQEQGLTIDGMESRLSALENTQEDVSEAAPRINRAEARITGLEETIKSIDASRAQLTSRLVRLSEQVDALQ